MVKFSGRMNSFAFKGYDLYQTIETYRQIDGITHLEFNYPDHVEGQDLSRVLAAAGDLKFNGVATRFDSPFVGGEFTNANPAIRRQAVQFCKKAIDACRFLKGDVLTIWQAYDGFDYPFQMDYEKRWNNMVECFREIADYGEDIRISIEYKPFEPRSFAMLDSIGLTLLALDEIDRSNMGLTLDFCHMLMKEENPAYGLALAARKNRLLGLHMNDGYRNMDNGLIFGSISLAQSLEFVYYMKKYKYDGVVFFDSFPVRENAREEIEANIRTMRLLDAMVDKIGMDYVEAVVAKQDGVSANALVLEMLTSYN